jgi:hypothetical protein
VEDVVHRAVDPERLGDVVFDEVEPGLAQQLDEVAPVARQQVIDAEDLVPLGQESLAEV